MSIYPKNITKGENLIIHLRFNNTGIKNEIINYNLIVRNPNDNIVYNYSDKMFLGSKDFVREIYHSIKITNKFIPGKYIVSFFLMCRGVKIESSTKNNDYFYVEKIDTRIKNNTIILKNNSNVNTKCQVFNEYEKKEVVLKANETRVINKLYKYIKYGNNMISIIDKAKGSYVKNPYIKIIGTEIMDRENNKKIKITQAEIEQYKKMPQVITKNKENLRYIEKNLYVKI